MLNRRHLRIRVLQMLYSWNHSTERDLVKTEKSFLRSLNKIEELYILLLLYIVEVRDYANNYSEEAKNKKMPTQDDLVPNTKFINNLFILKLKEESNLLTVASSFKRSFAGKEEMIRKIYLNIVKTDLYQNYLADENQSFDTDKKFVMNLFSKHLVDSELFQDYLNDEDIYWDDDLPFITSMVVKTIKDSDEKEVKLFSLFKDSEEKSFGLDLLRKACIHSERFSELIATKTKNWDLERVALIDLIMMQMALAEILELPTVPVKVTINEYVELAKYYSTANSKKFVNGILDSLLSDLKSEGLIKKSGRGLIE